MLGKRGPICVPTAIAVGLASAAGAAARARRWETEINATSMRYLARPATYSIAKARRMLGYEPKVSVDEGMRRTEAWLHEQGLV